MDQTLMVYCTCPPEVAERIARTLVEERLAACVSRLTVGSVYRWQGQVESADEALLLIKTRAGTYPRLQRRIVGLHPYELPEIIAVPVSQGLPAYLDWIGANLDRET